MGMFGKKASAPAPQYMYPPPPPQPVPVRQTTTQTTQAPVKTPEQTVTGGRQVSPILMGQGAGGVTPGAAAKGMVGASGGMMTEEELNRLTRGQGGMLVGV